MKKRQQGEECVNLEKKKEKKHNIIYHSSPDSSN